MSALRELLDQLDAAQDRLASGMWGAGRSDTALIVTKLPELVARLRAVADLADWFDTGRGATTNRYAAQRIRAALDGEQR